MDHEQASDLILATFRDAWDANAPAVTGGEVPEVEWPGVTYPDPKSREPKPWARIVVRHTSGDQRSFGEDGNRRFDRQGIVSVQVFTPVAERGLTLGQRLGKVALDAFEGRGIDGVYFRRAALREAGQTAHWDQVNITAEFTYDVLK